MLVESTLKFLQFKLKLWTFQCSTIFANKIFLLKLFHASFDSVWSNKNVYERIAHQSEICVLLAVESLMEFQSEIKSIKNALSRETQHVSKHTPEADSLIDS